MRDMAQDETFGKVESVSVWYGGDTLNIGTHASDTAAFIAPNAIHIINNREPHGKFITRLTMKHGLVQISSYSDYAPGYLHAMYEDLIYCASTGATPVSNGQTGMNAVKCALLREIAAA